MFTRALGLGFLFCLVSAWVASAAATRYVDLNSSNPVAPYTSWATAATNIQDAIDAATNGDTVLVTNGIYQTGGRTVPPYSLTNRVVVNKPVSIQSVNGPSVTVIQGFQVPATTNGASAVRCIYLTNGAVLSGFTLTNGATRTAVGPSFEDQIGGGFWSESAGGLLTNCILSGNFAVYGGGASGGTLKNCMVSENSASEGGGGAVSSTLSNCVIRSNNNSGARDCTVFNSTLIGNSGSTGGAAASGTLKNCALIGNHAVYGGGAYGGTLVNCTLTGNSATILGGGAYDSTLQNSLIYYNSAPIGANYLLDGEIFGILNYCCTTPIPAAGIGNFDLEPQLADNSHLSSNSPCRGAGNAAFAAGIDTDGEPWSIPPSVGCDEFSSGVISGSLAVTVQATYTNVAAGFRVELLGLITGHAKSSYWDFGDGSVLSNHPYASHSWSTPGDYSAMLYVYNDENLGGVGANISIHVASQPVHYVSLTSASPTPPYTNWNSAATNIQDAIDIAVLPGALILVTNGTYATGGRAVPWALTNRVAVLKPLVVQSVNGPALTAIQGFQTPSTIIGPASVRCVYLTNGAKLVGFTLTNGATSDTGDGRDFYGGGVWCDSASAIVSNCIITSNSAYFSGGGSYGGTLENCTLTGNQTLYFFEGGGAAFGALENCTLSGNSSYLGGGASSSVLRRCMLLNNSAGYGGGGANASVLEGCLVAGNSAFDGGGTIDSALINCTVSGNVADDAGGGTYNSSLKNCVAYHNTAPTGENYVENSQEFSCTFPLPTNGIGNFTNTPLFIDQSNGNFRLQSNSPCINAGNNSFVINTSDLDGNPRIVGGTVDMGAFEFQSPTSVLSYAWLQQFGLPVDGSVDYTDTDSDGHNNLQEWRAGTVPTNAASALQLLSPVRTNSDIVITWQSVTNRNYYLQRTSNLLNQPAFLPLATNITGKSGTTSFTNTNSASAGPFFYRVGVQ